MKAPVAPPPPVDFVGRRDEMRRIERLFIKRAVFLFYGVGGVGKTSLALAVLERPRTRRRYRSAYAACGSGDGLATLVGSIEKSIGLATPSGSAAVRATTPERLARVIDGFERWPVALVVDDLHRLPTDEATYLMQILARHLRQGRVLATSRRAVPVGLEEQAAVVEVALEGLPTDEAVAWMRGLDEQTAGPRRDPDELRRLAISHHGHPLLLRLALGRRWTGAAPPTDPDEISRRLVGDVLAGLGPAARRMAERLACYRRSVPLHALGDPERPGELDGARAELERSFLVETRGEHLTVHDLVRQAMQAGLTRELARDHHTACARWLRAQLSPPGVSIDADWAAELVEHALAAGDLAAATSDCDRIFPSGPAGAAVYLALTERIVLAGGPSTPTMHLHRISCLGWLGRTLEAAALLERVPEAVRQAPATRFLWLVTGVRIAMLTERWSGIPALYATIEREAAGHPAGVAAGWIQAAGNAARALTDLGKPRESMHLGGRLCRALGLRGSEIPALLRMEWGQALLRLGHLAAARVHYTCALRQFERDGLRYWESVLLVNLAEVETLAGRFDEARRHVARCQTLALRLGTPTTPSLAARLHVARASGQYAEARAALAELASPDLPLLASDDAFIQLELVAQELDLGQRDAARARVEVLVGRLRPRGGTWLWRAWFFAARILAAAGDVARALRLLRVVETRFARSGEVPWRCRAAGARVELLASLGRTTEAEAEATPIVALTRERGLVPQELMGELQLANLCLLQGALGPAALRLERVRILARQTGDERASLSAAELELRLALEAGRTALADRALARLKEIAERIGHQQRQGEVRVWRAVVLQRSGSERAAFRLAQEILTEGPPAVALRAAAHRLLAAADGSADLHRGTYLTLHGETQGRDRAWLDAIDAALRRRGRPAFDVVTHDGRSALSDSEAAALRPEDFDLWLDLDRAAATALGRPLDLTRKPMTLELLALFLSHSGRPLSLEAIVHGAWHEPFHRLRHESRVRKALARLAELLGPGLDGRPLVRSESRGRFVLTGLRRFCLISRLDKAGPALNARQEWLLGELERSGRLANRDFRKRYAVHRETARRDLAELVDKGLVVREGRGRGAAYRPAVRRTP